MQIRCAFCQNMYAINRETEIVALQQIVTQNLQHYDAHCPRCRRATRVMRAQLERFHPNWQAELTELEKQWQEQAVAEPAAKPEPKVEEKPKAEKHHHKSAAEKNVEAPAKPAKKPVVKKTAPKAEKKPASKPTVKKPAAKKPAPKKPAAKKK